MISGLTVLYDAEDLNAAEAAAIRAVDGRISLADAEAVAVAVLESVGMERKKTNVPAADATAPPADDLPEVRG